MAIIRQNLEFMSPEEGNADAARQNKITFMGFKSGDADFNDVTSGVGPITHYASGGGAGAGLNDVTIGGVYTGSTTLVYHVKIIAAASPDTFQFSADNGTSWGPTTDMDNSGGPQVLSNGVTVYFGAITGHTAGDYWTSSVSAVLTTLTTPLKMAEIEVNHEGKTIGTTVVHTTGGGGVTALVGDITSGGTYTGDLAAVTYYLKIGASTTFAWSTVVDSGYSAEITITGAAQAIEKGITADFDDTTGYGVGNIYTITIGADNKARMIIRTNEGGTVGSTSIHSGSGATSDMVSGGTYTGGPAPVTYYIKVTDHNNASADEFAWSTDNQHYSDPIAMTGSAQNLGGTIGTTVVHTSVGSPVAGDITSGGTYTGDSASVTYYLKIGATPGSGNPDTFAWSTIAGSGYGSQIAITGSAQAIEKGITVNFAATTGHTVNDIYSITFVSDTGISVNWASVTAGVADGDIYKFTVGADTVKLHSNSDFQVAGHVVSENGYIPKIFNSAGTVHLNAYS